MPGTPEIVFIFVAFIVAANLISKYFGEKHERTVKFEEARKDNPSKDGHGSNLSLIHI